jgi:hypothetical protein
VLESVGEVLTSPSAVEGLEFRRILEANAAGAVSSRQSAVSQNVAVVSDARLADAGVRPVEDSGRAGRDAGAPVGESIFTGRRPFNAEKLGAMVAYLVRQGHDIYKTNLNKLLFYSDMTAYFLRGEGMSGATYVNMPFGPVPDHVEAVIDALVATATWVRAS